MFLQCSRRRGAASASITDISRCDDLQAAATLSRNVTTAANRVPKTSTVGLPSASTEFMLDQTMRRTFATSAAAAAQRNVAAATDAPRVPIIHWFRTDLRLDDNSAFAAAAEMAQKSGRPLVPCYIINPDNFGDNKCHVPGKRYSDVSTIGDVPKIGKFRARFILDCVEDLREQLDDAGYGLLVATGSPESVFTTLIGKRNAKDNVTGEGEGKGAAGGTGTRKARADHAQTHAESEGSQRSDRAGDSAGGDGAREAEARHEIFCNYEIGLRDPESWYDVDATFNAHWGPTLYHIDDLSEHPYNMGLKGNFKMFMAYVQQIEHVREPVGPIGKGDAPTLTAKERDNLEGDGFSFSNIGLPSLHDLGLEEPVVDVRRVVQRRGGETSGLERMNEYLYEGNDLPTYWHTREQFGKLNSGSRLSAYIAQGCISPRRLYGELHRWEEEKRWLNFPEDLDGLKGLIDDDGTVPMIEAPRKIPGKSVDLLSKQLLWRDFYHFVAMDFDKKLFELGGFTTKTTGWNLNEEYIEAWKTGTTGYPLVDANMRELLATGFMSSRGRMLVASFLALDLKVDWRVGAEYFESMLIDHDISTNWGNWLNSAGLTGTTKGRPNKLNPISQARKFDKSGEYVKMWIPELANVPKPFLFEPWKMNSDQHGKYRSEAYPAPIVVRARPEDGPTPRKIAKSA